jgi:hypothetical protein
MSARDEPSLGQRRASQHPQRRSSLDPGGNRDALPSSALTTAPAHKQARRTSRSGVSDLLAHETWSDKTDADAAAGIITCAQVPPLATTHPEEKSVCSATSS